MTHERRTILAHGSDDCAGGSNGEHRSCGGTGEGTLIGFWSVTVTPEGNPSFVNAVFFCDDGTVTALEFNGRTGVGVWEKAPDQHYHIPNIQGGQVAWSEVWTMPPKNSYTIPVIQGGQVTWIKVGEKAPKNEYSLSFWEFYDNDGAITHAKVNGTIQLSEDGEHYAGPISIEIYDLDGKLLSSSEGTVTGVRQRVEPVH